MNKSDTHYQLIKLFKVKILCYNVQNQENIDPNIVRNSVSQQKKFNRSQGQKTPQSAKTGEISHSTNDEIEISYFQVGPAKISSLSCNQAVICKKKLEQNLTSNDVLDIFR